MPSIKTVGACHFAIETHAISNRLASFTKLPSRFSAEPDNRAVRAQLLEQVREQGYISNYSGVRIAADGRRFEIKKATVWNLFDDAGRCIGQAACFASWLDL